MYSQVLSFPELECFEIEIMTEADSNDITECPSTGMFTVSDDTGPPR